MILMVIYDRDCLSGFVGLFQVKKTQLIKNKHK